MASSRSGSLFAWATTMAGRSRRRSSPGEPVGADVVGDEAPRDALESSDFEWALDREREEELVGAER